MYNTVFNPETIETLAKGKDSDGVPAGASRAEADPRLRRLERDPAPSRARRIRFHRFVTPARFARWVADGVLERPRLVGQDQELYRIR